MTEENKAEKKHCGSKKGAMLAYGFIQLGTGVISALSLSAIALSFCAIKQESKVFNECVKEFKGSGKSTSAAVRFCNGG
ncbi:hypothetical protein [Prochlorococcus marinus]|uniref:Uncharacterized protein n=1 Tax=Prochlorococcus marinus (strain MIT 9211) TaxID=93059 RepID=A9BC38_PROM4|nr:hypothetical protein [Prochlorococcus marinus]ABX09400.1 Hypothetical protein P9211_14691 [Prochlorococcus marinus str. MIT 9211]